jgi:hypothetical protein
MTSDVAENPPTLQKAVQDKDGRKLSRGSITTGLSSSLTTGRWPRGASYVQRLVSGLRRDLERALAKQGERAEIWQAAVIQTACRHEARALLLQRKLREQADALTVEQFSMLLRDLSAASDARDRCLKMLGLDKSAIKTVDAIWDEIYNAQPAATAARQATNGTQADPQAVSAEIDAPAAILCDATTPAAAPGEPAAGILGDGTA